MLEIPSPIFVVFSYTLFIVPSDEHSKLPVFFPLVFSVFMCSIQETFPYPKIMKMSVLF